jgi:hypothetical protein
MGPGLGEADEWRRGARELVQDEVAQEELLGDVDGLRQGSGWWSSAGRMGDPRAASGSGFFRRASSAHICPLRISPPWGF